MALAVRSESRNSLSSGSLPDMVISPGKAEYDIHHAMEMRAILVLTFIVLMRLSLAFADILFGNRRFAGPVIAKDSANSNRAMAFASKRSKRDQSPHRPIPPPVTQARTQCSTRTEYLMFHKERTVILGTPAKIKEPRNCDRQRAMGVAASVSMGFRYRSRLMSRPESDFAPVKELHLGHTIERHAQWGRGSHSAAVEQ